MTRPPWLRSPATLRGRIFLAIAVVAVATFVGQIMIRNIVGTRVQSDIERSLRAQAQLIADDVNAAPDSQKLTRAANAGRYLVRTRLVVQWPTKPGLYVNVVPLTHEDAVASVRSGQVTVRMARQAQPGPIPGSTMFGLISLVILAALGVWILAGSLTRRLVRQTRQLAGVAEAIAAGDKSVRATETDDELGRVARAFNRMAGHLEDADLRQRRLLADIAHELRTPVTAIQGFAGALTDGTATSAADRQEAAEFIGEEATRLSALIADLRNLTLLDLRDEVALTTVALAEHGERALQRFGPLATERHVTLLPVDGDATVVTDEGHLDTILANLVANALNATPPGGTVSIRVAATPTGPTMAVSDTGVGIAPADLPKIFDRLYRANTSRSRTDGGSGLGLAIVHRLVDMIGATITVDSTVGSGSTFTLHFPTHPGSPTDAGTSAEDDE